jgi:Flp pilus assembly protein TadD
MNLAQDHKHIQKLLDNGWQQYVRSDYAAALASFESVLRLDVENATANSVAASCLLRLGRVEEAEPLARTGVRVAPQNALAHVFLADTLLAIQEYEEAESELWEAVSLRPFEPGVQAQLGRFLLVLLANVAAVLAAGFIARDFSFPPWRLYKLFTMSDQKH